MNNNDDGAMRNGPALPDMADIQEQLAQAEQGENVGAAPRRRLEKDPLEVLYRHHPECVIDYTEAIATRLPLRSIPILPFAEDAAQKDPYHRTQPFLTLFERTKIIGYRAEQLSRGARPFIPVPSYVTDVVEIARMELDQRKLPFIVKRPMPDGTFEFWRLGDLMIL